MRKMPIYKWLAQTVDAYKRCIDTDNEEWRLRHLESLRSIADDKLPSGAGFDNGTRIDVDASSGNKLVLIASYHHMDGHGTYDGWTEHTVTVTASLALDFELRISGRDRNDIKDHIAQVFSECLRAELTDEYFAAKAR